MILDRGFCTIYAMTNAAAPGDMTRLEPSDIRHQSWYGELNFETAPVQQTEAQEDVEISARVRVLQNRAISNHDVAVLSYELPPPDGAVQFEITRAFHGTDPDNGQPITDLTLREVQQHYDLAGVPRPAVDG